MDRPRISLYEKVEETKELSAQEAIDLFAKAFIDDTDYGEASVSEQTEVIEDEETEIYVVTFNKQMDKDFNRIQRCIEETYSSRDEFLSLLKTSFGVTSFLISSIGDGAYKTYRVTFHILQSMINIWK